MGRHTALDYAEIRSGEANNKTAATLAAEHLAPFIESTTLRLYPKEPWRGFKHWAVQEFLIDTDVDPPDQELRDFLRIDRGGDLGLDGYYPDPDNSVLYLFQSKHHAAPQPISNAEIAEFYDALPGKLLSVPVVTASNNPFIAQAHSQLKSAIEDGWTLVSVFIEAGWLTPEAKKYAEDKRTSTIVLESRTVARELMCFGYQELEKLYEDHTFSRTFYTDFTFDLQSAKYYETTVGKFRTITLTLPASQLLAAYEKHKFNLFRLNPRGPLGNTRANKQILDTLRDPQDRKFFNLYNNGITAVSATFGDPTTGKLVVQDFQVVNGCQTTVSLSKMSPIVKSDSDILVTLRIIEAGSSPTFANRISNATNLQNRLSSEDLHSNDNVQLDLQKQFAAMPLPIFYEIKRGELRALQQEGRADQFKITGRQYRSVGMKDVAQAALAFMGNPGDAKDKSRSVFEDDTLYSTVFPDVVRAEQLYCCWKAYEAADADCTQWAAAFPDAPYARFVVTALIGESLGAKGKLLSLQSARQVLGGGPDFSAAIAKARQAIFVTVTSASTQGTYRGPREFFRSGASYTAILALFRQI